VLLALLAEFSLIVSYIVLVYGKCLCVAKIIKIDRGLTYFFDKIKTVLRCVNTTFVKLQGFLGLSV